MNLQQENGKQLQLIYSDGYWQLQSGTIEEQKQIQQLELQNKQLEQENQELEIKLKKALKLAATLQLDLQELMKQQGNTHIKFTSEEQKQRYTQMTPQQLVSSKLGFKTQ